MGLSTELQAKLSQNFASAQQEANDSLEIARMMGEAALQKELSAKQAPSTVIGGKLQTQQSFNQELNAELDKQLKMADFKKNLNYEALSTEVAKKTAAETERMMQLSETVNKKKSVSFFGNPLAAVANEFTLPWDEYALQGSTENLDLLNKAKERLDARILGANAAADAVKETLTADAASSLKTAMAARLQGEAADAELRTLGIRVDALRLVKEGRNGAVDALLKQQQFLNTEEDRAERAAIRALRTKAQQDTAQGKLEVLNTIREGLRLDAGNPVAVEGLTDAELIRGYSEGEKTEFGRIVMQAYDNASMKRLGRMHVHGNNSLDAVEFRTKIGWEAKANLTPLQRDVAEMHKRNLSTASSRPESKKLKPNELAAVADANWNTSISNWETVIPGDKNNPLARATVRFQDIPEQFPGLLKDTPALGALLPLMQDEATKGKQIEPQLVFNKLAEAVAMRKISPQQAAIAQTALFKRVLAQANESTMIGTIGGKAFSDYSSVIEAPTTKSRLLRGAFVASGVGAAGAASTGVGVPVALGLLGLGGATLVAANSAERNLVSLTNDPAGLANLYQSYATRAATPENVFMNNEGSK